MFSRILHLARDLSDHGASKEPVPLMITDPDLPSATHPWCWRFVYSLLGAPPEGRATKN